MCSDRRGDGIETMGPILTFTLQSPTAAHGAVYSCLVQPDCAKSDKIRSIGMGDGRGVVH